MDIVDMLLRLGASVNRPTATKSTPIRGAAFYGHLKVGGTTCWRDSASLSSFVCLSVLAC